MEVITIVGNELIGFGSLENTILYSDVVHKIEQGLGESEFIQFGQGLSKNSIEYIHVLLNKTGQSDRLVNCDSFNRQYASKKESHKHKAENILITSPNEISEDIYSMDLLVDEGSELLRDHITGYHIQGMVLIEAARQAFLAVTEKYFYKDNMPYANYFVINKMDTAFHAFVFAIDTKVRYIITDKCINERRSKFSADIEFWQNEQLCTTVSVAFSVYGAKALQEKERALAQKSVNKFNEASLPQQFNEAV